MENKMTASERGIQFYPVSSHDRLPTQTLLFSLLQGGERAAPFMEPQCVPGGHYTEHFTRFATLSTQNSFS